MALKFIAGGVFDRVDHSGDVEPGERLLSQHFARLHDHGAARTHALLLSCRPVQEQESRRRTAPRKLPGKSRGLVTNCNYKHFIVNKIAKKFFKKFAFKNVGEWTFDMKIFWLFVNLVICYRFSFVQELLEFWLSHYSLSVKEKDCQSLEQGTGINFDEWTSTVEILLGIIVVCLVLLNWYCRAATSGHKRALIG